MLLMLRKQSLVYTVIRDALYYIIIFQPLYIEHE